MIVTTLETEWLGNTKFYEIYILKYLYHLSFDNSFHKYNDGPNVDMHKH